jgi:DNA-binding beta-propeller fold protein YncE
MRAPDLPKSFLAIAVVLTAGLAASAGLTQKPGWKAKVLTEDGVRVVRNPATPVKGADGKIAAVALVEDLVIGDDTSREDHWFGFLNALDVDAEGRIYTVDPKSIRIRIFGPDGELVKAFGRVGQGPGEFSGPGGIVAAPDGTFVVSDVLNARLSYFRRDGAHIKDKPFGTERIAGLAVGRDSRLYIVRTQMPQGGKQDWELAKFDPDLKLLRSVHSIAIPFKGRVFNLIPPRILFGLTGEDCLAWMVSTDDAVHIEDASGKPALVILRDREPRKITDEDKAQIIARTFSGAAPPQLEAEFPAYFPAASGLMTDEKGRIYVRTYETDGKGDAAVDVFDAAGLYVARFFVPEDEETVTVRNDELYVLVRESASGNPLVKRYAIVWK